MSLAMENNFWTKILYKKEFVENVVKDGEIYKKYRKVFRFKQLPAIIVFLLLCVIVVVIIVAFSESTQKPEAVIEAQSQPAAEVE